MTQRPRGLAEVQSQSAGLSPLAQEGQTFSSMLASSDWVESTHTLEDSFISSKSTRFNVNLSQKHLPKWHTTLGIKVTVPVTWHSSMKGLRVFLSLIHLSRHAFTVAWTHEGWLQPPGYPMLLYFVWVPLWFPVVSHIPWHIPSINQYSIGLLTPSLFLAQQGALGLCFTFRHFYYAYWLYKTKVSLWPFSYMRLTCFDPIRSSCPVLTPSPLVLVPSFSLIVILLLSRPFIFM